MRRLLASAATLGMTAPLRSCLRLASLLVLASGLLPSFAVASETAAGRGAPNIPGELTPLPPRREVLLNDGWLTLAVETGAPEPAGLHSLSADLSGWKRVDVPHNWDGYEGSRQLRHGNRHGTAWYRRTFSVAPLADDARQFLFFEGVGSYATVWVNGRLVGRHAGGLTTFTLDVTAAVHAGADNLLVVRADHPAGIRDLPWVCGGCERASGFSEGPQPFGINRPVHLVSTASVRIEPFGVHVWNDEHANADAARLHVRTELRNYGAIAQRVTLTTRVLAPAHGTAAPVVLSTTRSDVTLAPGQTQIVAHEPPVIARPHLWSPAAPALHTIESEVSPAAAPAAPSAAQPSLGAVGVLDRTATSFGIRTIRWTAPDSPDARFYLNGEPFFLNGVCDYEHNLGDNHAFTPAQIHARVRQIQSAGFNAFRDAHHPHNLRFQTYWDAEGLPWWTQFGAHVWFDNEAFRTNFKALLREWVRERRNSPSLILWGLQNESLLPTAFAEECSALIRELDPTASSQRKITTCNGGTGTDWDVPQNWSGTYSGDPAAYADDLRRQHLVGEYGAWRSLGLHTEGGFQEKAPYSEDRMAALLELKLRLAETVRGEVGGHFLWPFTSHANPGRNAGEFGEQMSDGIRPLDRIGPANNKGLFTIWGEPTDAYYLYRSNYVSAATDPMVYIVSHTWPDRWTAPGRKSGIIVYSNCEEVELFNDLGDRSLGRRQRGVRGTHFQWDDVDVATNVLYAEGRVAGQVVARDLITLHHLPPAPRFAATARTESEVTTARPGVEYLCRVNCGGPDYVDARGHRWLADREYVPGVSWGSVSWAARYPSLPPRFGSQRKIYDPVTGTREDALFQTFRYGRQELRYVFQVPDGEYELELYFIEPWYGTGSGADLGGMVTPPVLAAGGAPHSAPTTTPIGWRRFDIAVNGAPVLHDLDLWREAGRAHAVRKIVPARARNGRIELSFPRIDVGQAVISALALGARRDANPAATAVVPSFLSSSTLITQLTVADDAHADAYAVRQALDTGDQTYGDAPGGFSQLPPELLEADWIQTAQGSAKASVQSLLRFTPTADVTLYVAHAAEDRALPEWLRGWELIATTVQTTAVPGATFRVYRADADGGKPVALGANLKTREATALPMYSVFVTRRSPTVPAQFVRDVAPATVQSSSQTRPGRKLYTDANVRLVTMPGSLTDCDLVSLPAAGLPSVAFTVTDHVDVNLALDARITARPAWLEDWAASGQTVTTSDPTAPAFNILRRRFGPDQRVELGANGQLPSGGAAAGYFVIVRAVRPSVLLEAEAAALTGTRPANLPGATGHGAVLLPPGPENKIEWTGAVGVGDRYGLTIRYTTRSASPATPAKLEIIGADGVVLLTEPLVFPAMTQPGRWAFLHQRTSASINAGTYKFRLSHESPTDLVIDSLEIE